MYHFIVNPNAQSGHGRAIWEKLEQRLLAEKVQYRVYFTGLSADRTSGAIAGAIEKENSGKDCKLILLGGDGSINDVIQEIEHPEAITFGLIPAGSGNDFARAFHISNDPEEALTRILAEETVRKVDIGELTYHAYEDSTLLLPKSAMSSTRRFIVSCGIGFDAAVCESVARSKMKSVLNKLHLGSLIYGVNAFYLITHLDHIRSSYSIDGGDFRTTEGTFTIVTMITPYEGGGYMFCPKALPDDGKLDVCIVHDATIGLILRVLPRVPKGGHVGIPQVEMHRVSNLRIRTDAPMWVHTDGEVRVKATDIEVCCNKHYTNFII